MSRTKTMWCRQLLMLACAIVIFSVFFTAHASADYVNVTTGTSYSYFQTFSSSGVWTGEIGRASCRERVYVLV